MTKKLCNPALCTGCEACRLACPFSAITFQTDKFGFRRPQVNPKKCNSCGICASVCPSNSPLSVGKNKVRKVYAAWSKDAEIRRTSSSGGIFSVAAGAILKKGGVVFGARWDSDFSVVLDYCENARDLAKFRGSKYLQAKLNGSYEKARAFLDAGRYALFTGTPCQIAGLRSFLKKDYERLVTIDLVCHGVPSPTVFHSYLNGMESRFQSRVSRFEFRRKKPAWSSSSVHAVFENSMEYWEPVQRDPYFVGFTSQMFLRESCYTCRFASSDRISDLTISDFWGYRADCWRMRGFEKGCSAILVNTEKGGRLVQTFLPELVWEEKTIKDVLPGNLSLQKPWPKSGRSDDFWKEYLAGSDFWELAPRFFPPQRITRFGSVQRLMARYRFLVPEKVCSVIKKWKYR